MSMSQPKQEKKISLKKEMNLFISWKYNSIKLWQRHLSV